MLFASLRAQALWIITCLPAIRTPVDLERNHGYPGPFDTTAQIVQPSITGPGSTPPLRCYLYCDSGMETGCPKWHANSCQDSWPNLPSAVDVINFHYYANTNNPEDLNITKQGYLRYAGVLNQQELSKPLWMGEGSWGNSDADSNQNAWWQDPYAQGGFVARYFAILWSQTLPYGSNPCNWTNEVCQQAFWYGYDYDTTTVNNQNYRVGQISAL